jgi:hypothetical protein
MKMNRGVALDLPSRLIAGSIKSALAAPVLASTAQVKAAAYLLAPPLLPLSPSLSLLASLSICPGCKGNSKSDSFLTCDQAEPK